MASELGVQTIQHTNGTDAITIDSSGNTKIPGHTVQVVRLTSWSQIENTNSSSFSDNQSISITPKYNDSLIRS